MEQALIRIPALEEAPVRRHVNGPESFTPDGRYLLGEAPECRNFYVAAGFNSIGIASGAGAGRAVAEWIVGGRAPLGLSGGGIRPAGGLPAKPRSPRGPPVGMGGALYALHPPGLEAAHARSVP